jgi:outer membrane biosynthesis protein TonB
MAGGPQKPGSKGGHPATGVPASGDFEGDDSEETHISDELPLDATHLAAAAKPPPAPHRSAEDEEDNASSEHLALPPGLTGAHAPLRPRPVEAELTGGHAPLRPSQLASQPLPEGARQSPLSGPPPAGAFAPAMPLPGGRAVYRSELDAPDRSPTRAPVLLAAGLHVALLISALVVPKLFGGPAPLRKPIIARLVAQGKPRDQKLMPRKEEPPPPPPAAPPRSSPEVSAPPAPAAKSTPAKTAPSAPAPRPRAPSREELMQKALASVSASPDRERSKAPPEEREGDAAGSPDGTAATAEEGDLYFAKVQAEILSHYTIPSIISERERMALKAVVVAWIAPDGKLVRYQFDRRSGNAQFDAALERAIKASRIPAPPPERAKAIRDEGVALEFTP